MYTFLIHGNDSRDHHVKVNAQSGKVIQIQSAAFTKAQVQSIALKIAVERFNRVHMQMMYTHFNSRKDNKDHHVKINAETGKVIKVEAVKFTQEQAKQAALQQHKGTVQSVSFSEQAYTFVIKGTNNIKHTVKSALKQEKYADLIKRRLLQGNRLFMSRAIRFQKQFLHSICFLHVFSPCSSIIDALMAKPKPAPPYAREREASAL